MLNFVLGIIWGFVLFYITYKFSEWKSAKKIAADISSHFKEVLSNLKMNQAVFVSRVNQTVIVDTRLAKLDVVNSGNSPWIKSETGLTKPDIVVPQVNKNSRSIPNCFFTVFKISVKKFLSDSNLFITFSEAFSSKIFLCCVSVIMIFITNKY